MRKAFTLFIWAYNIASTSFFPLLLLLLLLLLFRVLLSFTLSFAVLVLLETFSYGVRVGDTTIASDFLCSTLNVLGYDGAPTVAGIGEMILSSDHVDELRRLGAVVLTETALSGHVEVCSTAAAAPAEPCAGSVAAAT